MKKIQSIVAGMSLEDKIAFGSGASFWQTKEFPGYGIPAVLLCDGPHGLRKQDPGKDADMLGIFKSQKATCFPSEVTSAGSWDPELLRTVGSAIGVEAKEQGVGFVLGPGANLKRNPLCGRNFEYFSEDPLLSGKLAAGFIQGIEGEGIGTSLKHFAANSQEKSRFNSDSILDERTLRELYLTAFEIAVKEAGPATVMCAYPKLNGSHCSDNHRLLTRILREEWGFEGFVVTDWGGMNDRIEAFRAGCDLAMPGGSTYMEEQVARAVRSGKLPESAVDASATCILKQVFRVTQTLEGSHSCDYDEHHELARRVAEEGAVLLENRGGILPLAEGTRIAVIGALAKSIRFQGGGSSHINPTRVSQPLDSLPATIYADGCDDRGDTNDALVAGAELAAREAEVAVVFAGLPAHYESEGYDRENMLMPEGHVRLIRAVAAANPRTVVVLLCGAPVECDWADEVAAILYMGLPGQAGGEAIANLLYGRANPCGRLAESWPLRYQDVPSAEYFSKTKDALYLEGIYVGYRYYEKAGVPVRWPFGYGLGYTSFAYSDLEVADRTVRVKVSNTGSVAGAEVVQLYVAAPQDGLHRPLRELKAFAKVRLEPGATEEVSFRLDERSFAVWQDGWRVPGGRYEIQIADLAVALEIAGEALAIPAWQKASWYESLRGRPQQGEWEKMLGRRYQEPVLRRGEFTVDNSIMEMRDFSLVMKIVYNAAERAVIKAFGGKRDYENPRFRMMLAAATEAPLRSMVIFGSLKEKVMLGLLDMANGHFFRGLRQLIGG
ncbi:MAG: glycoside hydrolase family 3 C-terminal domain-containing protein [Bacillota bacterium]|nr:glycoside hydrolase family 3 C-terminal domain-containing protein [Bacillota bacterium]